MSQIDTEQLPDAVQWAEGMLLTPQHFQQHDIYWNAVLHQRLSGLSAHGWGVRRLDIRGADLPGGAVVVDRLDCVFPDGTPYVMRPDPDKPWSITIKPEEFNDRRMLRICATIPPRTGSINAPATSIKRFERIPGKQAVIDEMTGIADVYVDRIRPKVELCREQDVPAGYHAIPLIELVRNVQTAQIAPSSYHPPMLSMAASAFLGERTGLMYVLNQLRDRMWSKLHKLIGMAQVDGPERVAAMGAEERMQLQMARHIASSLPMFDAIMLAPDSTPRQAYEALAQVVGCMAWVGSNPVPLVMVPYSHENCAPQFIAAIEYVSRKLALINTDWDSLAFTRKSELAFSLDLPSDAGSPLYLEVHLREGQSLHDVQAWLGDSRIGSEDLLPMLRQRRMPGAQWQMLGGTEAAALGLRGDAVVVRLDNKQIEAAQGLTDCFGAGRSIVIQSEATQHMPAAVLLRHKRSAATAAQGGARAKEAGAAHA